MTYDVWRLVGDEEVMALGIEVAQGNVLRELLACGVATAAGACEQAVVAGPGLYRLTCWGDDVADFEVSEGFEVAGWQWLAPEPQEETFTQRCRGQSALAG